MPSNQVRDISDQRADDHEHVFTLNGVRYTCPVSGCWWNGGDHA